MRQTEFLPQNQVDPEYLTLILDGILSFCIISTSCMKRTQRTNRTSAQGACNMATTVSTSKARVDFAEMINQVAYGGERVVLDRHGKPIAAIIPIDDLTFLEEIENRMDIDAAKRALAESDERIPYEKLRQELGLK